MALRHHQICVTRDKPRYAVGSQRADLDASGCTEWIALGPDDETRELIDRVRRNDVVKVRALHLLVRRKRRTDQNVRRELWEIVHQIEERGATIHEVSTGRTSANQRERDTMIADAIEVLTRGARAMSAKVARENGKLGGRPRTLIKDEQRETARRLWFEAPEIVGLRLRQSLRRTGYSLARCYREFGPRGGRET